MKMRAEMSFQEMDALARYLFSLRRKSQFQHRLQDGPDTGQSDISELIDYALAAISADDRFLLVKEYLDENRREWWREYYSRSAYYRHKSQALRAFLRCLSGVEVVI